MEKFRYQLLAGILAACLVSSSGPAGAIDDPQGRWGTTDTSRPESIRWPKTWVGEKNLRAQWFKILAEDPDHWRASGYSNHAKGEPPDNTYFLWRYDEPLPEGTKILIEGDFPHARMMSFQVTAPWNDRALVSSDGTGLPEVHLLDEDIVPDPGSTNPFLPGADRRAKRRHYHITFLLKDGDPLRLNPRASVPPYRAPGNLRVGGTGTVAPGSFFGRPKTKGPAVYLRMYLPDNHDPFGGVEPPVIRLQLPGKEPELAPISRGMPVNLTKFISDYKLTDNPADREGFSAKEREAQEALRAYARKAVAQGGEPGTKVPAVHRLFTTAEGTLRLFKSFQTPYFKTYLKDYVADPEGCREKLPARYRYVYGDMGPRATPPGNDEHVSNHHVFNTYLTGAANLGPGQLLVFHGKAPRTPRTLKGNALMEASDQLRYWNITLQAGTPTKLTPVINITDEEVSLDERGFYTVAIGRREDRPAAADSPGVTWREWPVGSVLSVSMRFMSTAADPWEHAPQRVTWEEGDYCGLDKNPEAVRRRMGPYYPEGRYMDAAGLKALVEGKTSTAPHGPAAAPGEGRLMVGGRERTFRVFSPSGTKTRPAVIVLHGGQSTGRQMEGLTGLSTLARREGFLAVYPDAVGLYNGKIYWNDGRVPEVDDVAFISALIDELVARYGADPGRIYATGFSNGASMTNRLGYELTEKIAAIAPVAGTLGVRAEERWRAAPPMPVIYFHGTKDPFAYFDGGSRGTYRGSSLPVEDYVRRFAERNGCRSEAAEGPLLDQDGDGRRVTKIQYSGCREGAGVEFFRIEGGGHTWPGRRGLLPEEIYGLTTGDVSANEAMWEFFKNFSLSRRR